MRPDDDEAPPGLQRERTLLAWDRTALALLVSSALLLRAGEPPYLALRHLPAAIGMVVAGALFLLGDRRYHQVDERDLDRPDRLGGRWSMVVTTATTMLVGVTAIVLIGFD